jgi:hypothetical protein
VRQALVDLVLLAFDVALVFGLDLDLFDNLGGEYRFAGAGLVSAGWHS